MSNTQSVGDNVVFGSAEMSNIVKSLIRGYKFLHNNQAPKKIVFPRLEPIEGVQVEYEQPAVKKPASK